MISCETLNYNELKGNKEILEQYTYALIYGISEIKILKSTDLTDISNWEEFTEIYLFNNAEQIHAYLKNDSFVAVKFSEKENEKEIVDSIDKEYVLSAKFSQFGSKIVVREYLGADEDGQIKVVYTKLVDIK